MSDRYDGYFGGWKEKRGGLLRVNAKVMGDNIAYL
jgi:hypothetical protein